MQIYTKFANFTGLYFHHFTTIRDQTVQFYSFYDALSSYGNGFRSSCLDQNFVCIHFHLYIYSLLSFLDSISRSRYIRDLTILGRQRDDDGQNKLLQINGSKDNSSYIINCVNLIQSQKLKTWVLWLGRILMNPVWSCTCCGLKCSRCIKTWKSVIWRCKQSEDND
jgi:hypothetical protein